MMKKNECIYIGTYLGGLSRYDLQTGQFYNYLEREEKESPILRMKLFSM